MPAPLTENNYARAKYREKLIPAMLAAQWHTCPICGCMMINNRVDKEYQFVTFDHVIPKSRGGPDLFGNLLLAHKECNEKKANDMPTGCEMIWLLSLNTRLGFYPQTW